MKGAEERITEFLRDNMRTFQKQLDTHSKEITDTKVKFGLKVDNYHSEVLWRIQNAEEMIKKCVPEQRVKDMTEMHENAVNLIIADNEKMMEEKLLENVNNCTIRIKANEAYTTDKFKEAINYVHQTNDKVNNCATIAMIEQLAFVDKDLKNKFNTEFEQFQQYLKD